MDHKQWVNSFWDTLTRLLHKTTWSNYAILFGTVESSARVLCLVWELNLKKYTNGVQRRASRVRRDEENWVCLLKKRVLKVEEERELNMIFSISKDIITYCCLSFSEGGNELEERIPLFCVVWQSTCLGYSTTVSLRITVLQIHWDTNAQLQAFKAVF